MVGLGTAHGVRTTALLTAMEQPLGRTAGNAVEVEESVEVLAGGGPEDLVEVTLALAREMVELAGLDVDPPTLWTTVGPWTAGGPSWPPRAGTPMLRCPSPPRTRCCPPTTTASIQRLDAMAVGVAAWRLGAGRARKEDAVSATAGVVCHAKVGDGVRGR